MKTHSHILSSFIETPKDLWALEGLWFKNGKVIHYRLYDCGQSSSCVCDDELNNLLFKDMGYYTASGNRNVTENVAQVYRAKGCGVALTNRYLGGIDFDLCIRRPRGYGSLRSVFRTRGSSNTDFLMDIAGAISTYGW